MVLPRKILMTDGDILEQNENIRNLKEVMGDKYMPHFAKALFLIEERELGEKSFWKPYIDTLPPNMDSFPLMTDEEDFKLIEGMHFAQQVAQQQQYTKGVFQEYIDKMPYWGKYEMNDILRSYLHCASRQFSLTIHG